MSSQYISIKVINIEDEKVLQKFIAHDAYELFTLCRDKILPSIYTHENISENFEASHHLRNLETLAFQTHAELVQLFISGISTSKKIISYDIPEKNASISISIVTNET
ncbi:MAG: hypothetical protein NZZ41_05390 [Candidatus Dojkabacteria bacterium]|nr:hypothetical protein [Candidatus Dojkabacteria bacterium]